MQPPVIAVFGASQSSPGDGYYEAGRECGRLLAEAGYGVVTGGYGGLMEAVSRGATEAGGTALGVTAPSAFPERHGANEFVTTEIRAASLTERIHELVTVSSGAIVLHGSIGTLTELAVAWNIAFIGDRAGRAPHPVVAVGPRWRTIVDDLAETLETNRALVSTVDDVTAAVDVIRQRVPVTR